MVCVPRCFLGLENVKSILGSKPAMRKIMWVIVQDASLCLVISWFLCAQIPDRRPPNVDCICRGALSSWTMSGWRCLTEDTSGVFHKVGASFCLADLRPSVVGSSSWPNVLDASSGRTGHFWSKFPLILQLDVDLFPGSTPTSARDHPCWVEPTEQAGVYFGLARSWTIRGRRVPNAHAGEHCCSFTRDGRLACSFRNVFSQRNLKHVLLFSYSRFQFTHL
jgi:hypothetical protein